ncbi:amidohydrolase family protein [Streptomyces sp. B3I8]|uniref:amidohydrolase family protein n=1 Tax=Streptomyces sp. B3I8 TaxID=3042303 RepID=UPI002782092F|nr:amidohydrolase family protein [Streptomyces sp. B3I8]MDQ0785625.1 5-methylthioadenosine/S-adenosylhomocysteine deaminase [Streptomyces sp. B3I8]
MRVTKTGKAARTLVRGGTVLTMDPVIGTLPRGDLLVEDGRVAAVAEHVDAPGAEIVDARGMIVTPGFVDTHRHTWQTAFRGIGTNWTFGAYGAAVHGVLRPHYRPEDVYVGDLLGRLEALSSGVTTLLDWFHCSDRPENADAAIQALRDAPGHSVFCYGAGVAGEPVAAEVGRVRAQLPDEGMALGLRGPQRTPMDTIAADVALARELGLRVSVHVHAAASPPGGDRPVARMRARGLLDDRTTFVHGNGLSDDEVAMLADAGCSVSISPDVELRMGLGLPETGRMLAAGIRPSLSVDNCLTAGGDMFATMRTALSVQRGADGGLTARDVLEFATVDGARTLGRGSRTGSLGIGKDADFLLLDAEDLTVFPVTDPVGTLVCAGHPGLVDSVFVAGRPVKRDGRLLGVDLPTLRTRLLESRARIAEAAGVPLDGSWTGAASTPGR